MKRRVSEIAEAVGARVVGDASVEVSAASSIASASPGDIVFLEGEKGLPAALQSRASAVIAGAFRGQQKTLKAWLSVLHPPPPFPGPPNYAPDPRHPNPGLHPAPHVLRRRNPA